MAQADPDVGEGPSENLYNPEGIRPSRVVDVEGLDKGEAEEPPAPWPVSRSKHCAKPGAKRTPSVRKHAHSKSDGDVPRVHPPQ